MIDRLRTLSKAAGVLNQAQLDAFSPQISGLGKQLDVIVWALAAMQEKGASETSDYFMSLGGTKGTIQHAEIVLRKIAEDETLSRLIHDRTCAENKSVSVFAEDAANRLTSNIIANITSAAKDVTALKEELYDTQPLQSHFNPDAVEENRKKLIGDVARDLSEMKSKMQQDLIKKK